MKVNPGKVKKAKERDQKKGQWVGRESMLGKVSQLGRQKSNESKGPGVGPTSSQSSFL